MSDQGVEAELELHLATTVQTASQNTAYSSSGTSRRDGKDGHLHCMDAHGLRVSAAFDTTFRDARAYLLVSWKRSSCKLLRSNPPPARGPILSELASVNGRGGGRDMIPTGLPRAQRAKNASPAQRGPRREILPSRSSTQLERLARRVREARTLSRQNAGPGGRTSGGRGTFDPWPSTNALRSQAARAPPR